MKHFAKFEVKLFRIPQRNSKKEIIYGATKGLYSRAEP